MSNLNLAKIKAAIMECLDEDSMESKDVVHLPDCYCVYVTEDTARRSSSYYPVVGVGDLWYLVLPLPPKPSVVDAPCALDAYAEEKPEEEEDKE